MGAGFGVGWGNGNFWLTWRHVSRRRIISTLQVVLYGGGGGNSVSCALNIVCTVLCCTVDDQVGIYAHLAFCIVGWLQAGNSRLGERNNSGRF